MRLFKDRWNFRMDGYYLFISLCLLLERTVNGQKLLSLNTSISASSQYGKWYTKYAVDGDPNRGNTCECCAATENEEANWFRLDLEQNYTVYSIFVLGRLTYQTLENMDITLGASIAGGMELVKNVANISSFNYTLPTPKVGRYITFTQRDVDMFFVICEIYVYAACDDEHYGQNCNETCGKCFGADACYKDNGTCPGECEAGFEGNTCKDGSVQICDGNKYGQECVNTCGHCLNLPCETIDGTCTACAIGYKLPMCQACDATYHGHECKQRCYCANGDCNKTSGICHTAICSAGYSGEKCDTPCDDEHFGQSCNETCGKCFGADACYKDNGICPGGCEAGYEGNTCKDECLNGTYGLDCQRICGNCLNTVTCNKSDGSCAECASGYTGDICVDKCENGTYGLECQGDCGHCFNNMTCNTVDGSCTMCSAGYLGDKCIDPCSWGKYGMACEQTCGNCESNQTCDNVNGTCRGCITDYLSPMCKDCIDGRYGTTCNEDCGHCNNTDVCDKRNGNCQNGCSAGYKGTSCKTECEDGTFGLGCQDKCGNCFDNETCNKLNGKCATCAAGYKGHTCVDVCQCGTFGFNCKQRCGMCQEGDVCDIYTGECPNGCTDEYKGSQCSQGINQDTSCSSNTCISLPVFIGSLFVVIVVNTTSVIGLVWLFYRKRLNKKTQKAANNKDTSFPLPNTPSNYDTLQFDNPDGESTYTELNRRS